MRAGKLDRTIELLSLTSTRNEFGEEISTMNVVASLAASREALRTVDAAKGQLHSTVLDGKFVIRFRDDVTTKWKVSHEGVTFDIVTVEEIGRKRGLILLVRAG